MKFCSIFTACDNLLESKEHHRDFIVDVILVALGQARTWLLEEIIANFGKFDFEQIRSVIVWHCSSERSRESLSIDQ